MNLNARKQRLLAEPGLCTTNTELHKVDYSDSSSPYIYYRVFGYAVGAAVHLLNILAMALALRGPIMKDPDIELFYSMEFFYITIWNLAFQVLYIGMGLVCDVPVLLKSDYNFLNWLRWYRRTFYSGILWPCGLVIFIVYWPVYAYNRNLIFPDYIDKALSQASNYVMHMFIVFPIFWDLFFLPNQKPSSQKNSLVHCVGLCAVYHTALFSLYGLRGVWPYPVLKLIYGTIYFPLVLIVVTILALLIYFAQWPLIYCIWRKRSAKEA